MTKGVTVTTPKCMVCGKFGEVEVDSVGHYRWKHQGVLIQLALPNLSTELREQLKTGTHPACWDEMFPDEEDE